MVRWLRCTIRAGKPAICTKTEPDDDESAPPLALERFRVWPAVLALQNSGEGRYGRVDHNGGGTLRLSS